MLYDKNSLTFTTVSQKCRKTCGFCKVPGGSGPNTPRPNTPKPNTPRPYTPRPNTPSPGIKKFSKKIGFIYEILYFIVS